MIWSKKRMKKPLLIAGPCSAETREQVLETAEQLSGMNIDFFRAGVWKPRTRPGAFEGAGSEALQWLKDVKDKYQIPVCTEVARSVHVEEALKAGIDLLWIGARTAANPFAVQEVAEALTGVDVPVLVKNPVSPDLKLWIGAIERMQRSGITRIGAIHRGFAVFQKTQYRNAPMWPIPLELQSEMPDLPIICDPSHIGGCRSHIHGISREAFDYQFNGLMVEAHCRPGEAWTDAKQQITPLALQELLQSLDLEKEKKRAMKRCELQMLRMVINGLDEELIALLSKRMDVSRQIGHYKKENSMDAMQKARWDQLLQRNLSKAQNAQINEGFIAKLFHLIHEESVSLQENVVKI
jgi:chorismate mutase